MLWMRSHPATFQTFAFNPARVINSRADILTERTNKPIAGLLSLTALLQNVTVLNGSIAKHQLSLFDPNGLDRMISLESKENIKFSVNVRITS